MTEMTRNADAVKASATHHISSWNGKFEAWIDVVDFGQAKLDRLVYDIARTYGVTFNKDGSVKSEGRNAHKMPTLTDLREKAKA